MNAIEKEIQEVEKVLSKVAGKKPHEISPYRIIDLYNFPYKYLDLLEGLSKEKKQLS